MRGTVVKPKGRRKSWGIKVRVSDPLTGAKKQKWFGGFATRKEAEARLSQVLVQIHGGGTVPITKRTVGEFLQEWLDKYAAGLVRETSLRSCRHIVRQHLIPALGAIPLRDLTALHVQGYYTQKLKGDEKAKQRPLTALTVRKHGAVLHAALEYAVKTAGLLVINVCDRVKPPRREHKEPKGWDEEQTALFLGEARRSSTHYGLFLMLATTGLRPGEALGLRWQDVDLTLGTITVKQKFYRLAGSKRDKEPTRLLFGAPKTERGRRTIDIPSDLVAELRKLKDEHDRLRAEFGSGYRDLGEYGPLVFCQPDGRPLNWENIARRDFRRIAKRVKLPMIRPYEFGRHGHAAWMYKHGIHPTVISQRLGHSSVAFTMDTYGHLSRGMQQQVVTQLQAWLSQGNGQGDPVRMPQT